MLQVIIHDVFRICETLILFSIVGVFALIAAVGFKKAERKNNEKAD